MTTSKQAGKCAFYTPKFSRQNTLLPSQYVLPTASMPTSSAPTTRGPLERQNLQLSDSCPSIWQSVPLPDNLRSQSSMDPNVMGTGLTQQHNSPPWLSSVSHHQMNQMKCILYAQSSMLAALLSKWRIVKASIPT